MKDQPPAALTALLTRQQGVVARWQPASVGLDTQLIDARLRRDCWQRLYTGVYATFTRPPPRLAVLWAALLRAGPGAVLSHETAAELDRPHGLPPPRRQAGSRLSKRTRYLDGLYQHYGVAVELDGRASHPAEARWQDIRRDNASATTGIVTLRYGWSDVTDDPCRVAAEIAAVLQQRGWRGQPHPCGPHCPIAAYQR